MHIYVLYDAPEEKLEFEFETSHLASVSDRVILSTLWTGDLAGVNWALPRLAGGHYVMITGFRVLFDF